MYSKSLKKATDDVKLLSMEIMQNEVSGVMDIDTFCDINGEWYIFEFLKCDTVKPFDSHPNRYWFKNKTKFIKLWSLVKKLEGRFYCINYEDSREQFKVIRVLDLNEDGICNQVIKKFDFDQYST